MFQSIRDYNFYNKNTLLRCDFNVPQEKGKIKDDFKIKSALFTINFLKKQGAKIIIMSHLGDPQTVKNKRQRKKQYSLLPVSKELEKLLVCDIDFAPKIIGSVVKKKIKKMKPGDIIMLENLRFHKAEQENNYAFAEKLANMGQVYVSEAFSVCHREHASIAVLPTLLPRFIGYNLEKEIQALSRVFHAPPRPLVVIIGGAKVASKMKIAQSLLKQADFLLFGGIIANTILTVKGICPSRQFPEQDIVETAKWFDLTSQKIYLPVDVIASAAPEARELVRETAPGAVRADEDIFDIGKETVDIYSEIIKTSGSVFWAGSMGFYQEKNFSFGTKSIAKAIADSKAELRIVGGGETVAAVREFNLENKFSFMSGGGGAMLAFLAREKMPGLEALKT